MGIELPVGLRTEMQHSHGHALICPHCNEKETPMLHLQKVETLGEDARLEFSCENCGQLAWLDWQQYKGQTLVGWDLGG